MRSLLTRATLAALVVSAALASGCAKKGRLLPYAFVDDLTNVSVWGLVFSEPTERVRQVTPLFEPQEASGGVGLDPQERYLFTANYQGVYSAIRLEDRSVAWRHTTSDPLSMAPLFVAKEQVRAPVDLVLQGTQAGVLFAVQAKTGQTVWSYDVGGEITAVPTVAGGRVIVMNSRNQVMAFDVLTGKWLWQYSRDFPVGMTIAGHSGVTATPSRVFVGFSDGFVVSINIEDGVMQWARPLTLSNTVFADVDTTPVLVGNRLFAASVHDGVHALNAETGEVLWQLRVPNVTRIAASDPYVYAVSTNGRMLAIETESGRTQWEFKFPIGTVTTPVVFGGYVTFGSRPGGLYVLEAQSGRVAQRYFPGAIGSELAHSRGHLAFLSESSIAYYFRYGAATGVQQTYRARHVGL